MTRLEMPTQIGGMTGPLKVGCVLCVLTSVYLCPCVVLVSMFGHVHVKYMSILLIIGKQSTPSLFHTEYVMPRRCTH